jgi:hypothetical protein
MVTESEEPTRKQDPMTALLQKAPPGSAIGLWLRGELNDLLGLPDEARVEVIEGEVFVSPSAVVRHSTCVRDVQAALIRAEIADPMFGWRYRADVDLVLEDALNGYVPDLILVDAGMDKELDAVDAPNLMSSQIAMAVEVTSPSNSLHDRAPTNANPKFSKWRGYARVGVPFYLLVDRHPRFASVTLYGNPSSAEYETLAEWSFGELITLPGPFNFTIDATGWKPW